MKSAAIILVAATLSLNFGVSEVALAQTPIDPSSAFLLNGGSGSNSGRTRNTETGLDSGRYTVRPRPSNERPVNEKPPRKNTESTPTPSATPSVVAPAPNSKNEEVSSLSAQSPSAPQVLEPDSQGHVVVSDGPPASVFEEKSPSRRLLEISLGSIYFYRDSDAAYSLRRSTLAAPGYGVDAKVWLSPEFAIGGRHDSTLGGNITGSSGDLATNLSDTAFGVYLKRSFSKSNLIFGFEFVESNFDVSDSATDKLKSKSTGFRLAIEGEFAHSEKGAWVFGFSASPKLQHEEGATATHAQSGKGVSAYAVGASLERRWKFDDSNALFVRVQHRVERDLFTGAATVADPVGGATPDGVSVTVGTTLIQFGYNWGN